MDRLAAAVAGTAIAKGHDPGVLGGRRKPAAAHLIDRFIHPALAHGGTTIAESTYRTLVTATGTLARSAHYLRQADDNCHDVVHVRGLHEDAVDLDSREILDIALTSSTRITGSPANG